MTDSSTISWRAIVYDTPVLASDGSAVGRVREVLGSDAEDIFHGVRVAIDAKTGDDVVVSSDRVTSITGDAVTTDLGRGEAASLPRYEETSTYHLASVGWLRKHLGWAKDSQSDEESG